MVGHRQKLIIEKNTTSWPWAAGKHNNQPKTCRQGNDRGGRLPVGFVCWAGGIDRWWAINENYYVMAWRRPNTTTNQKQGNNRRREAAGGG